MRAPSVNALPHMACACYTAMVRRTDSQYKDAALVMENGNM